MAKAALTKATLGRLPLYLDFLRDLPPDRVPYISSAAVARGLGLGEVQVRKDLAAVSGAGKPRVGYVTEELIEQIQECLGGNRLTPAVLVGAGKLGRALLQYGGFEDYGVKITAAFDSNEQTFLLGGDIRILPMNQFTAFCRDQQVRIGIITVGVGSAQMVCDRMVESGITAVWNFAPCKLQVPRGVLLQNENLALSLAHLRNQLHISD